MEKTCRQCHQPFSITDGEITFPTKISPVFGDRQFLIPLPELCPECRQKRRLRFRNERNLYARNCDLCKKDIIAVYPVDAISPVYCPDCWWSDRWNAFHYGQSIDWSASVLSHCATLLAQVPVLSLINTSSENSTYAHDAQHNKNCYLVFSTINSADSLYVTDSNKMRNCVDCYWSVDCELCYELISGSECYASFFSTHCYRLNFSYFCYDCQNCTNCFGCFHLAHKEYHIFNQAYTKEEYEKKLAQYKAQLLTGHGCEELRKEVQVFWDSQPHKYATVTFSDNCVGDYVVDSKNCYQCFNVVNSLDSAYLYDVVNVRDTYDCSISGDAELLYNCQSCTGFMNICCSFSARSSNIFYSDHCFDCHNCFGCVGLSHQSYCIFNKQYSEQEYQELVPRLIQKLIAEKQWGEFFPESMAPIAERDSVLNYYYPLPSERSIDATLNTLTALPEVIGHKTSCLVCQKDYLIVAQEQAFYQAQQLPTPLLCPTCRHKRRIQQRPDRRLYPRKCDQCQVAVESTYPLGEPTVIYCEKCYAEARGN